MHRSILPVLLLVVAIALLVLAMTSAGDGTYIALGGAAVAVASVFVALRARR